MVSHWVPFFARFLAYPGMVGLVGHKAPEVVPVLMVGLLHLNLALR